MRRKIVAILLAVMTVSTAVIGCGDNKTTETESKKVETSTETSDHDEIKKYIKNADEIVIVKDAKNLDLEKAVNSLVSEEQKAKVESVTVDDSKVDSTKAGTYPLTITVKLKAETTEQNIVSATTDNSAESMDTSTSEKEPDTEADKDAAKDTVKDTVDVIVAEKKDAEDLLNKGSAVIGDDSKVEVKEDKKNASNDGKEEEKKTEDSSKQEVSNKTDSKKEESKKEDTKKNDTKKEPSKQEKTAKNDSKKNETSNKSNTSTSNKKQETTKPSPSTSTTTTKPATNSGSNKDNSNKTETKPVHQHNYVAQTHVVHHEATGHNEQYVVQDAWDEQVTTYEDYAWECCNVCGADCTADPWGHMEKHALAYEGGGYHTEYGTRPITKTVHHEAVYGTRWVQDSAAYDETVIDGYVCSCGARK